MPILLTYAMTVSPDVINALRGVLSEGKRFPLMKSARVDGFVLLSWEISL